MKNLNFRLVFFCFSFLLTLTLSGQPLVCNDLVLVALGADCTRTLEADQILEGGPYCYPCMGILVDRTPGAPDCDGPWSGNFLDVNDLNQTYCVLVTDAVSGNTCVGSVHIVDNLAPNIQCPSDQFVGMDANSCFHTAANGEFDLANDTSNVDNCTPVTHDYTLTSITSGTSGSGSGTLDGVAFNYGQTLVKWISTDLSGNSATCTFIVQVDDTQPPQIACPPNMTFSTDPGQCTYTVQGTELDPTSWSENCPLGLAWSMSGANNDGGNNTIAGYVMQAGLTTVDWVLVENYTFNLVSCSFTVQINDNEPPNITCSLNQTRTGVVNCTYTVVGNEFNPTAAGDNCTGPSLTYVLTGATNGTGANSLAGEVFQFGLTTVEWTITDGNSASNTCSFLVSISTTAVEVCNNIDDDCDGLVDEGVQLTFYADADGDGYGDPNVSTLACTAPPGFVANNTDCDDTDPNVNPGEIENCANGIDDDCDGLVDETRHPDYDALMALYNATNGFGWYNRNGWASGALGVNCNVCTWNGVTCNSAGRVQRLQLINNNLIGNIPPEIGDLSNLQQLLLDRNKLSGSIPPEIGNLGNLEYLYLLDNQLSGNIPPDIGNLGNLQRLILHTNQLTGSIPPEIGNLGNLEHLQLYYNQLTGSIPPEIGDLGNLQYLYLYNNQLSGNIPPEIGNLGKLRYILLSANQLSGSIPPEIGDLVNLSILSLGNNQLSGSIPPEIGNLGILNSLQLPNNQLSGCFPSNLSNICGAQYVNLSNNPGLPGGGSPAAWQAFCHSNGSIGGDADMDGYCNGYGDCDDTDPNINPAAMEICNNGKDENCNGLIDEASSHPDFAALMDLYNATGGPNWTNKTGWGIDCNVCGWYGVNCNSAGRVFMLDLSQNNLIGTIPNSIGSLTDLQQLWLFGNQLNGPVPASIGNLTTLKVLALSDNQLGGLIPASIGSLTDLQLLYLSGNQLSGPVPASIGNLTNLQSLILSNNQLNSFIPASIGQLTNLQQLWLFGNQLSGPIPTSIGNLTNLQQLILNNNQLGGLIPASIGNLTDLQLLYLNDNQLSGPIPISIGNLTNLQILLLNNNQLSGCLPGTMSVFCGVNVNLNNNPGLPGGGSTLAWQYFCAFGTGGDFDGDGYCNGMGLGDCNDNNNTVYPGAPEICDGLDNDCDNSVDENIPASFTATVTVSCSNPGGNQISISGIVGGTPPYQYKLNNGLFQPAPTFINLSAGTYQVTVKDANGCSNTQSVTINPMMTLNTSSTKVKCRGGADGAVSVSISGGTPGYVYLWRRGSTYVGNTATVTGLIAGNYRVTVRDKNGTGCVKTSGIVTVSEPVQYLGIGFGSVKDVSCNGGNDGSITAIPSGGVPPYTYSWSNFASTPTISNLTAGTYTCTLTDANGCTKLRSRTITQPSVLTLSVQSIVNQGGGIWKVTLSSSGGTSPRQYKATPPGGNFGSSNVFYLSSGTYLFEVKDNKGCMKSLSYTLFAEPGEERENEFVAQKIETPRLILFPNPGEGQREISALLIGITTDKIDCRITDATGREVFRRTMPVQPNEPLRLPVEHLSGGIYLVAVLTDTGKIIAEKLVLSGQ